MERGLKVLIGGCSFSESQKDNNKSLWTPYSDLITENVTNIAVSSYGQTNIGHSIVNELIISDFNYDLVIVQWSAIGRGYSRNELEFYETVIKTNPNLIPNITEYVNNGLENGQITSVDNVISNEYYRNSLTEILLTKSFLDLHNVKYKMFWGWNQINNDVYYDNSGLFKFIYDENFWLFGTHGGLNEFGLHNLYTKAIVPNDFHPTTLTHELFYNHVVSKWLDEVEKNKKLI